MFDISKLLSNIEKTIKIDEQIIFEDNYLQNTDIIEISPVSINGEISKNDIGDLELSIYVTGELVLPCSITLEPVKYPFSFEINEIIDELIEIKETFGTRIEEEIYTNMNYDNNYADLTEAEIKRINELRKKIYYIYESIGVLDKIKEAK